MTDEFKESVAALKKDPHFAPLIKKYGPPDLTRLHGGINVFQALLRSIIFQQLSGKAAGAIQMRVLALFPTSPRLRRAGPAPEALLKIPSEKLRAAGLSIQKINYVRDLAHKCIDGTISEKHFPTMTSQEIIDHLVQVKGVGKWTAEMVLIFTLHRTDILPTGDLAIQKGFKKIYNLRAMPDHKKMEKLAKPWRAHASIASWYLWKEMDGDKSLV